MNDLRYYQRSQCFNDLKKAEEVAQHSHKGIYSKEFPLEKRIKDCTIFNVSNLLSYLSNYTF